MRSPSRATALLSRWSFGFRGNGSAHALTRTPEMLRAAAAAEGRRILFRTSGKGPRADQYLVVKTTTYAGKQFIAASLFGGDAGMTGGCNDAVKPMPRRRAIASIRRSPKWRCEARSRCPDTSIAGRTR